MAQGVVVDNHEHELFKSLPMESLMNQIYRSHQVPASETVLRQLPNV